MTQFKDLNLSKFLLETLKDKGYVTPTDIQREAIPSILDKRDLLGIAQTGTGKTAAFSIPIIENLVESNVQLMSKRVRALILTPTRELANQINENVEIYSKKTKLKSTVVFGGVGPLSQVRRLSTGVDILIATPGRLLDLMTKGHVKLDQLEIFVLDEADRMLDMGFIRDVERVIAKLPKKRQSLFFSATMPKDISNLAGTILKNPVTVEVTPASTPVEVIEQRAYHLDRSNKPLLLIDILKSHESESVLVFTKTKYGADRVAKHLDRAGFACASIHSNRSQGAREKALKAFREREIKVLVATDIAARGIDVDSVSHVINYDVPLDAESYVHRIGRTARAGREGSAMLFCDPSESKYLKAVEKLVGYKIQEVKDHPYFGAPPRVAPVNNPAAKLQNPNLKKKSKGKPNHNSAKTGSKKKVIKPGTPSKKRFSGKKKAPAK
ncbi:DEAD/DEAH box helicase [Halobacteriovorax sp. JY17]|uniref:DEAD/DEAH box helicase n=1 Tax=Halobacteriovorax sp. JY17 TaxID=2014617 RepID=UPI000C659FAA|nr:DEAD/DEAH box helicase [Halobacteriovorax sp. JY17]PIK13660.1 MAG: DEAD/DEAH box helicase [Halobacteriovorax sp. JY17]